MSTDRTSIVQNYIDTYIKSYINEKMIYDNGSEFNIVKLIKDVVIPGWSLVKTEKESDDNLKELILVKSKDLYPYTEEKENEMIKKYKYEK